MTKICKKCGMPMEKDEDFGTNADGSKNEEYCKWCLKDGVMVEYCQSCGMPMTKDEDFGTEADGSKSKDYCNWCYQQGKFTNDYTMEQMMEECTKINWNESGEDLPKEKKLEMMKESFPHLKRWKTNVRARE